MGNIRFSTWENNDYLTLFKEDSIKVYKNEESNIFFEYNLPGSRINGAVYAEGMLNITTSGGNVIYRVNASGEINKLDLSRSYEMLKLWKYLSVDSLYVIRVIDNGDRYTRWILFDMKKEEEIIELPMTTLPFTDIAMYDEDTVFQMVKYRTLESHITDDNDEMEYRLIKYNKRDIQKLNEEGAAFTPDILLDYTGVLTFETWEGDYVTIEHRYGKNARGDYLRFPLFDYWSFNWPEDISISAYGSAFLQWSEDIHGIYIGSSKNGEILYYFKAPDEVDEKADYYFNEKNNVLYIVENNVMRAYRVFQDSNLIRKINTQYNRSHMLGEHIEHFSDFCQLFYGCMETAELKLISEYTLKND